MRTAIFGQRWSGVPLGNENAKKFALPRVARRHTLFGPSGGQAPAEPAAEPATAPATPPATPRGRRLGDGAVAQGKRWFCSNGDGHSGTRDGGGTAQCRMVQVPGMRHGITTFIAELLIGDILRHKCT
jgi:hypothetical protein